MESTYWVILGWKQGGHDRHTTSSGKFAIAMQGVIVDMCVGEGCVFGSETVHEGMSAFLHCALHWQPRKAEHVLSQSLAWVCDLLSPFALTSCIAFACIMHHVQWFTMCLSGNLGSVYDVNNISALCVTCTLAYHMFALARIRLQHRAALMTEPQLWCFVL